MDISNMILSNLKWKALEQITAQVGWDNAATKAIAAKALPMILGQLSKNAESKQWAESINTALNSHLWESKIDVNDGKKILWHIFGWSDNAVAQIAEQSGQSKEQASGVMGALSSVIMETLGDQKKAAGWFWAGDVMKMLSGVGANDSNILGMVMDQDGDGDFDKQDAMKFGMGWIKNKFLGKK